MKASRVIGIPVLHWAQAARDITISAGAAGVAWWLGMATGHPRPVFAAIAAVVCLAPGVASHGRQAVGMLTGVTIGIVAGEAALALAPFVPGGAGIAAPTVTAVMLVALFAAASFGLNAVMIIQSGASAAIVIGAGQRGSGIERITDAAIGASVGLLCSQILFSPDPVARIDRARADLHAAIATPGDDPHMHAAAIRMHAAALETAIDAAAGAIRWTLRGRLCARAVAEAIVPARHDVEQVAPAAALDALRFRSGPGVPISAPMQRIS